MIYASDMIYFFLLLILITFIIMHCSTNYEQYTKKVDTFCTKYLH